MTALGLLVVLVGVLMLLARLVRGAAWRWHHRGMPTAEWAETRRVQGRRGGWWTAAVLTVGAAFLVLGAISQVPPSSIANTSSPAVSCPGALACGSVGWATLTVTAINRDYQPRPGDPNYHLAPHPGLHIVSVAFKVHVNPSQGIHNIYPTGFALQDPLGHAYGLYFVPGDNNCGGGPSAQVDPGGTIGPSSVCFEAGGPVEGQLVLVWTPYSFKAARGYRAVIPLPS